MQSMSERARDIAHLIDLVSNMVSRLRQDGADESVCFPVYTKLDSAAYELHDMASRMDREALGHVNPTPPPSWLYPKCPGCGERNNPTVNHTCY